MIARLLGATIALLLALAGQSAWAAEALPCTPPAPVAQRCAPTGQCSGPVFDQFQRAQEEVAAVRYAREMGQAVDARAHGAGLDRAADIAQLLMPRVGHAPAAPSQACAAAAVITPADGCTSAAQQAFARYLPSVLSTAQMQDVWSFLLPRAGLLPPPAGQPLTGWRFTALATGPLPYRYAEPPGVLQPPHIAQRRDRAGEYLRHHPTGTRAMAALALFLRSWQAGEQGAAQACPAG